MSPLACEPRRSLGIDRAEADGGVSEQIRRSLAPPNQARTCSGSSPQCHFGSTTRPPRIRSIVSIADVACQFLNPK